MNTAAEIVCHAFLEKTPDEYRQKLIRFLPPEEQALLNELGPTLGDPTRGFPRAEHTLKQIHPSWMSGHLRTLPEADIRLFLACLPSQHVKSITSQLLFSNHLPHLSFFAAEFLRSSLLEKLAPPTLIPHACLPQDPLNPLLDLDFDDWKLLIDALSMHDLATEIRCIIDTVQLKRIYEILSPEQHAYLKQLAYRRESITFKKMGLANWNGDPEAFAQTLIQRGINRIAKALYGRHASLIWYASRKLDMEQGSLLIKLSSPLDHPEAVPFLTQQVIELIERIKHPHPESPR